MNNEKSGKEGREPFYNCDSAFVFSEVVKLLSSGDSQSLWRRIEKELQEGGVGAVDTYLRSSFSGLSQKLWENIARYQESMEK